MDLQSHVATACEHLYDLVYLRTHPLLEMLVPDPAIARSEAAWKLHHALLDAIQELDPGPHAPAFCREWRRHRLLVLRYVDCLDPDAIAAQLAMSRSTYYREQEAAIGALAALVEEKCAALRSPSLAAPEQAAEPAPQTRLELLRLEAVRVSQAQRCVGLLEVMQGATQLVQEMASQGDVRVRLDVAGDLPSVGIEPSVMRQMLLGLLSYLVGDLSEGEVWVRARPERDDVLLSLRATGRRRGRMPTPEGEDEAQLAMAQELARMQNIRVEQVSGQEGVLGFDLLVRSVLPQTILVVDDNEDVLQLYERFLSRNRYHVITARSADEALRLAESRRPAAITLDLMMPDPDGWEALQSLKNHPATQHIPVIVCSVLAAKTLALSLGAAAFLGKPVTEQSLLSALRAL